MQLFIWFFVMDYVPKIGGLSGIGHRAIHPIKWPKKDFLSSINDDVKRGCFTVDHSLMHGCFPIYIQYQTTALGRILFISVVMVLAYGALGPWFESRPNLIFLPCIYSFVSLIRTLFVRK